MNKPRNKPAIQFTKYSKVYSSRLKSRIEKLLIQYCVEKEETPSEVIQTALECFLTNPNCLARKKYPSK